MQQSPLQPFPPSYARVLSKMNPELLQAFGGQQKPAHASVTSNPLMVNSVLTDDLELEKTSTMNANETEAPTASSAIPSHINENNNTNNIANNVSGAERRKSSYGGIGGVLDEYGAEII
jgi:hypothetical protein